MSFYLKNFRFLVGSLSAIGLTALMSGASVAAGSMTAGGNSLTHTTTQVAPRPDAQQIALQVGEANVTGENGQYTGQVLVRGSIDTVWHVLTDYNNFKNFLPNVTESRLLQTNGNQKVFEQTNVYQVLIFTRQAHVVIATNESYPHQISFNIVNGDVQKLQGSWKLQPVGNDQVLITHQVNVVPKPSAPRDLFFNIYKNSLKDTLAAVDQEVERRSGG